MSCPPFIPGIAANPSPGFDCPCTGPIPLPIKKATRKPAQIARITATRLFIAYPRKVSDRGASPQPPPPSRRLHRRLAGLPISLVHDHTPARRVRQLPAGPLSGRKASAGLLAVGMRDPLATLCCSALLCHRAIRPTEDSGKCGLTREDS